MKESNEANHSQTSHPLFVKIFSQYFLLIFMIFLVLAASAIVIWTAFFLPENEMSASGTLETDVVSLIQARDLLADWARNLPAEELNLSGGQILSDDFLPETVRFSDLQKFTGVRWLIGRDGIGLENLPGDEIDILIRNFEGKKYHLFDGWVIWCPLWETNCYFQLVDPENLVDLTSIEFSLSE